MDDINQLVAAYRKLLITARHFLMEAQGFPPGVLEVDEYLVDLVVPEYGEAITIVVTENSAEAPPQVFEDVALSDLAEVMSSYFYI